jgi:hypothetical protein
MEIITLLSDQNLRSSEQFCRYQRCNHKALIGNDRQTQWTNEKWTNEKGKRTNNDLQNTTQKTKECNICILLDL